MELIQYNIIKKNTRIEIIVYNYYYVNHAKSTGKIDVEMISFSKRFTGT